jgi:acetyl esterase/lipase
VACAQQLIRNYNHSQRVASQKNDKSAHFPRPAAVLALYPMVDLLSSWWTAESHEDSTLSAKKLVSVRTKIRRRITDEDFSFGETFAETDEEVYEQPRWEFVRYILQSATFADHLTGIDGLCEKLASKSTSSSIQIHKEKASSPESYEQLKIDLVPENARKLFPVDFDNMSSEFPPLFVVHGQSDRDVPLEDSKVLVRRCHQSNVPVQYWWLEGLDHCFDFEYGDLENSTIDINDVGLVGLKSIVSALESLVGI